MGMVDNDWLNKKISMLAQLQKREEATKICCDPTRQVLESNPKLMRKLSAVKNSANFFYESSKNCGVNSGE